jgi:hypothetical protein
VAEERQYVIVDKQTLDVGKIQTAANEAWAEMKIPGSELHAMARAHGLTGSKLPRSLEQVLQIRPAGAGIGAVEMVVAGYLGKAAWDLWKYIVMPYIEDHWGVGVIREKLTAEKRVAAARAVKSKSRNAQPGKKAAGKRAVAKKKGRRRQS